MAAYKVKPYELISREEVMDTSHYDKSIEVEEKIDKKEINDECSNETEE